MQKNVGQTDKWARLVVGGVIVAYGVYSQSWWGVVGLVPIVTALAGVCPLYNLIGINTCPVKTPADQPPATPPQA